MEFKVTVSKICSICCHLIYIMLMLNGIDIKIKEEEKYEEQ